MLKVTVVSDSTYTVQGHGVHTAFLQHVRALKTLKDVSVTVNGWKVRADVTHIHTFGPIGLYHALFGGGRTVISAHVVPDSLVGSIIGAKLWLPVARWYLRWFYNRADVVVAVSPATADVLKAELRLKRPIVVVPNAIDTTQFAVTPADRATLRDHLRIAQDAFVVLGCGQLQPRKRADVFAALAKQAPDMQFMWVGGIPFKRLGAASHDMEALTNNQLPNFTVTGVIPYQQAIEYFKAADVFLFPSEQETFGLVVIEAAAAGMPVVARDIDDYKETFGDDITTVAEDDFLHELQRLQHDKQHYASAQKLSHKLAQRYDNKAYARQIYDVYTS